MLKENKQVRADGGREGGREEGREETQMELNIVKTPIPSKVNYRFNTIPMTFL
jgi:hypothetical protein